MKPLGETYRNAEVLDGFRALPGGGYIVRITDVVDHDEAKPYLEIVFDIASGEYANYYGDEWGAKNTWAHRKRQYYNPESMGVFKGFLKAIDEANGTTLMDSAENGLNEKLLIGCNLGLVVGLEEYETNKGTIATRPDWFNAKIKPLNVIREGNYTVPDIKAIRSNNNVPSGFAPVNDDEIPFL